VLISSTDNAAVDRAKPPAHIWAAPLFSPQRLKFSTPQPESKEPGSQLTFGNQEPFHIANASAVDRTHQAKQKRLTEDQRINAAMRETAREAAQRLTRLGLVLPTKPRSAPKKRAA